MDRYIPSLLYRGSSVIYMQILCIMKKISKYFYSKHSDGYLVCFEYIMILLLILSTSIKMNNSVKLALTPLLIRKNINHIFNYNDTLLVAEENLTDQFSAKHNLK